MIKITLEKNSAENQEKIPYFIYIELAPIKVPGFETQFHVPIYFQYVNGKGQYTAEICGFHMQAGSPSEIFRLSKKVAPTLVNFSRMPTYIFIAQHARKVYPVYTNRNEVFAITTPGGPVIRHIELAKVRQNATHYLNSVRALGTPEAIEKLHVRGVHRRTLGLVRPLYYLKKRPQANNEHEFWAPVFPSSDGYSIFTYAASGRREVEFDTGHEAFRLRTQVAQALIADQRLREDYDLRLDRVVPDYWQKIEQVLEQEPENLYVKGIRLKIYRQGRHFIAVEHRGQENRYSLYMDDSLPALAERATRDFVRRGLIHQTDTLKIEEREREQILLPIS